ncbi:TPA: hypothetical protein PNO69_004550 [Salmonella enterica]|nr:hypothetical protein [Salmonella enterica]HCH9607993.1 hypothetical protein [Salmonella enterica]HDI5000287.1 hypothetical protein [Salmonella enterica]HDI5005108.1 hypothetical protein [Salmonella enterica]
MGVKFNHQEVIDEVFEQYNCGSLTWNSLLVNCQKHDDSVRITDQYLGISLDLHIDQAQKLKEILNDVLN